MPTGDVSRVAEVDAFLNAQRLPAVVAVQILAERGCQGGRQSESRACDGQVRYAARAGPHAGGPHLGTGPRGGLQADEDDVEEDDSGEEDIELRVVGADGNLRVLEGPRRVPGGLWLSGGAGHGYLEDQSSSAVMAHLRARAKRRAQVPRGADAVPGECAVSAGWWSGQSNAMSNAFPPRARLTTNSGAPSCLKCRVTIDPRPASMLHREEVDRGPKGPRRRRHDRTRPTRERLGAA